MLKFSVGIVSIVCNLKPICMATPKTNVTIIILVLPI